MKRSIRPLTRFVSRTTVITLAILLLISLVAASVAYASFGQDSDGSASAVARVNDPELDRDGDSGDDGDLTGDPGSPDTGDSPDTGGSPEA